MISEAKVTDKLKTQRLKLFQGPIVYNFIVFGITEEYNQRKWSIPLH